MSQDLQAFLRARAHLGELAWGPGLALSAALHLAVAVHDRAEHHQEAEAGDVPAVQPGQRPAFTPESAR